MQEMREFLTVREVAQPLRITGQTVRRWIQSGQITAQKVGRDWVIPTSELDRLLALADGAQ